MATEYVDTADYRPVGWHPTYCNGHNRYINFDGTSYTIGDVAAGQIINLTTMNQIIGAFRSESIRAERTDANDDLIPYDDGTVGANTIRNALEQLDALYTAADLRVYTGNNITAANINTMIDYVQAAGTECVCHCNYGCTCHCNYGCTCNCNYASDEELKTNIVFI